MLVDIHLCCHDSRQQDLQQSVHSASGLVIHWKPLHQHVESRSDPGTGEQSVVLLLHINCEGW